MATESLRIARGLIALAFGVTLVMAAHAASEEQPPPDVKRICVPAADGRNWECGTADNPPAPRELPPPESRPSTAAPPPFFLANPAAQSSEPVAEAAATTEAPRTDDFPAVERVTPGAEVSSTDATAGATTSDAATTDTATEDGAEVNAIGEAPAVEATPVDGVPVDATVETTSTETLPTEVASSDAAAPDPYANGDATSGESAPTDAAADTSTPVPEPLAPIEPVADTASPEPAPVDAPPETIAASDPAPMQTALESGREPLDSSAFRALDPKHQTVQLARAASRDGFAAYAWTLGLAPESTFAVPYDLNGATVWLLLWSDFPDFASARAAADALTRDHRASGIYVRRIGPLQRELAAHGG